MENQLSTLIEIVHRGLQAMQQNEQVEFFHVGRNNPYIQKCDKRCNERLDAEGFKS